MKILVLQNGWSGFGVSGGDQHVLDLCVRLKNYNDVIVMAPKLGLDYINSRGDLIGVKLWELNGSYGVASLIGLPLILTVYIDRTIRACAVVLKEKDLGLVISSSHFIYDVLPAVFYKLVHKAKIIVYIYHLLGSQKRKGSLRNFLAVSFENLSLLFIKRFFDVVVTDNRETYKDLLRKGIKGENLVLGILGVRKPDPGVFNAEKKYDLVYLGRISRLKGAYDLVEILRIMKETKPDVSIDIIGRGEDEEIIRAQIRSLGLNGNFIFSGFLAGEEKIKELAKGRVFLFPSYEEGWGIALAEAMSLGLPCVAYKLPAVSDVFGDGPVYSPVGDWKDMASQALRLLSDFAHYDGKSQESFAVVRGYYLDSAEFKEFSALGIKV